MTEITISPTVTANVGTGDNITANALTVLAQTLLPASGYTAQVDSQGSAGALVGITSTNAVINNNSKVKSFIGDAAFLSVAGATMVTAVNTTRQKASADSNSFGLVAAGLAYSNVSSNTDTEAYLGSGVTLQNATSLSVNANGHDENRSRKIDQHHHQKQV